MLVLSRSQHEKIAIGNDIFITVMRIEGGRVRLGIEAPADVSIQRSELLSRLADRLDHHSEVASVHSCGGVN